MKLPPRLAALSALCFGALTPLSLAPFKLWPIGIACAALLMLLLRHASPKQALWRSFCFGAGMFGSGASWVYISIHDFGMTSAPLAVVMTALFALGLALVFALPFAAYARFISTSTSSHSFGFAAIWTLGEWSRSWLLTGFPWLYIGYGHVDTWLKAWAPWLGVFGLTFLAVLSGTILADNTDKYLTNKRSGASNTWPEFAKPLGIVAGIWLSAWLMQFGLWQSSGDEKHLSVAIVQPNIPLEKKWNPLFRDEIIGVLREETHKHLDKDLIIWPEASVPLMYHDAEYFLDEMNTLSQEHNSGIILGILYDDDSPNVFFNGVTGVGRAKGIYFKQRLVPFGEYVPLEEYLRGLIAFFNLPTSIIYPGPKQQDILSFDDAKIAPSICYEIVYPDLVAAQAQRAQLLITISNDAWFGASIGPLQHFQMARMRALENRRFLIRGTNTGLSGIFNPRGEVVMQGRQFERNSYVYPQVALINDTSFFSRWGSVPIVVFCCLILLICGFARINGPLRTRQ